MLFNQKHMKQKKKIWGQTWWFDLHQYHCTTSYPFHKMYCCSNEQKSLTSYSFQISRQLIQCINWKCCFKDNFKKSYWKKILKSAQLDALCNPTLSKSVSPTSSPTSCAIRQWQQLVLLPCLSPSLSHCFSLYLLFIKYTFSELTQEKPPTSPSNAFPRQISADLQENNPCFIVRLKLMLLL